MRAIGRGAAGTEKLFSIMNVSQWVSSKPLAKHYEALNKPLVEIHEEETKETAWEWKRTKRKLGKIACTYTTFDVGVKLDCSWCSQGWSATNGMVAAIDVDTGKVLDVVNLSSSCLSVVQ